MKPNEERFDLWSSAHPEDESGGYTGVHPKGKTTWDNIGWCMTPPVIPIKRDCHIDRVVEQQMKRK